MAKNIGDLIRDAVQDAIASQDYSKLNDTVSRAIGAAAENISNNFRDAQEKNQKREHPEPPPEPRRAAPPPGRKTFNEQWINQPYEEKRQQEALRRQEMAKVQNRYMVVSGMKTSGYLMAIVGGILSFAFLVSLIPVLIVSLVSGGGSVVGTVILFVLLAACISLFGIGVNRVGLASRFQNYTRIIGTRTYCDIRELADRTRKQDSFVLRNVRKMLSMGLFRYGHLDEKETCLMVTEDAWQQYQSAQAQLEERRKKEQILQEFEREKEAGAKRSAEAQAVLDEGNAFLTKIRACNDAISGEEISRKISRMEVIVQKIFQRAQEHPEVIPDLKRLMEYYLPTTVKLLDAYADLDRQPIQGENITSSKREIEQTLDTLNVAFEKLLDSIFRDVAWDVSSDISVLHTVLAQEGLTESAFDIKNKGKKENE